MLVTCLCMSQMTPNAADYHSKHLLSHMGSLRQESRNGFAVWVRLGVSQGVVGSEAGLGRGCFTPTLMVGGRPQFFPHGPSAP